MSDHMEDAISEMHGLEPVMSKPVSLGNEAAGELVRACVKHKPMHGAHEGYAVILEELDELWDEVKAQTPDKTKMRKEALQVAAMALRFVWDICDR